jgi:hypothetical protein
MRKLLALFALSCAFPVASAAPPATHDSGKNAAFTPLKCAPGQQKLHVAFMFADGNGAITICTDPGLHETESGLFEIRRTIERRTEARIAIFSTIVLRS